MRTPRAIRPLVPADGQELRSAPRPTELPGTFRLRPGDAPGWRGMVRELVLWFEPDAAPRFLGARLRSDACDLGAEPSTVDLLHLGYAGEE